MVDRDSKSLKGSRRRMNSPSPITPDHALDQAGKFSGGLDRTAAAGLDDRSRDPSGTAILAVFEDNSRQFGFGFLVHDIVGAQRLAAIHAHVNRPIEPEA